MINIKYYILHETDNFVSNGKPYLVRYISTYNVFKVERFNWSSKTFVPFYSYEEYILEGSEGLDYNILSFSQLCNIIKKQLPNFNINKLYIDLAKFICFDAHFNQVDKQGEPYYKHPFAIVDLMIQNGIKNIYCILCGYLHDVIEDTFVTINDLYSFGFPSEVVNAVSLLTHEEGVSYNDYLLKIINNPIALTVKKFDLMNNLDPSRRSGLNEKRKLKYINAINLLKANGVDTACLEKLLSF